MKPQPCKIKLYIYYQIFIIFIYKINKSFFSNNIFKHMLDIIQSVYINSSFKCIYMMQMLIHNQAMHCHSQAFIEGYVSPKYTLHLKSH